MPKSKKEAEVPIEPEEDPCNCRKLQCPEDDSEGLSGVLLSDEIERYTQKFELIDKKHFNPDNLKPAGYELTIGRLYAMEGEVRELSQGQNEIKIPPFQCVIISTAERINLPRFLIARWNLRVNWVYKGLLWLGAPQVDPGYCGQLFCPIFNLSKEPVTISFGDSIALIDFTRTTNFSEKCKPYKRPPKRKTIYDYNIKLESALFSEVEQKIKDIKDNTDKQIIELRDNLNEQQKEMRSNLTTNTAVTLTVFALLFAVIAIIITNNISISYNCWIITSIAFATAAIALSLIVWLKVRKIL